MKNLSTILTSFAIVLGSLTSQAAADLGGPAPALRIAEWIKGQPLDLAKGKGKQIFVVEFWATWCPPCRASIPHLTGLQKKFKDKGVVVIGVSDEKLSVVKPFVQKMGDKMDYAVALDKERKTSEAYLEAFDISGIPHAFVVDKEGRLVWHGHPMGELEATLQALVDGKFDLERAKKRARADKLMDEFFELATSGENEAKADQLAKELEKLDHELGGIREGQKFDATEIRKSARFGAAVRKYQRAVFEEADDAEIEKLAQAAEALAPKGMNFADFKANLQLHHLHQQYYRAVSGDADEAKVKALGRKLGDAQTTNAEALNNIAWTLLTDEKIKHRDLELATKLAKRAYDACDGKKAHVADTYARALFDTGKKEEAIRLQKKAVELSEDDEDRAKLEETLKKYQSQAAAK
jgi:thiol-disulfide isomerase/thioredoxin